MEEREAKVGLVAIACGALALGGLAAGSRVDAFAPCRVAYRIHQAVQDSLACHMYSAIGTASLLLLVAAAVSALTAGVLVVLRRNKPHTHEDARS
jgi:hypothetical protein